MITITFEKILDNIQKYMLDRKWFYYDTTKKQKLFDIKNTPLSKELHQIIRAYTDSDFYENRTFMITNENEVYKVKIIFAVLFTDLLNAKDILIMNDELLKEKKFTYDYFEMLFKWLDLNVEEVRKEVYKAGIF